MHARITIDKAGRIIIPKDLRDQLHLQPGDALDVETTGEQLTLRPIRSASPMTKEHGVWVFRTGAPLTASAADSVLDDVRQARDESNFGRPK